MTPSPNSRPQRVTPELQVLVNSFYPSLQEFGQFTELRPAELPLAARNLLWHDEHMTVALEAHHDCHVQVDVLGSFKTAAHYTRHVLLSCESSGKIVQYGIVRLNHTFLDDEVRRQLESEEIPLGRVLIKYNVLRHVRLLSLWRVRPGADLCRLFRLDKPETCYGRTALIYCNEAPAVELLEIVTSL